MISRTRLQNLSLSAATLVVLGVLLECALIAYHDARWRLAAAEQPPVDERALVPSEDPELVYEFNPGWSNGSFSVNAWGMADEPVELAREADVMRIAFVGDSITANFGHQPRDEIYLELLEDELRQRLRVETLNFGVNGYGIRQIARMARTRALRFQPDLLIAQLCLNDPYASDTPYLQEAPLYPSRLRNFVVRRLWPDYYWADAYVRRRFDEQGWQRMEAGLEELGKVSRSGTPTIVLLFPYLYRPAYEKWGLGEIHSRIEVLAKKTGIRLIDLHGAFESAGLMSNNWPMDPIHPDTPGHVLVKDELLSHLEQWNLIPASQETSRQRAGDPADSTSGDEG